MDISKTPSGVGSDAAPNDCQSTYSPDRLSKTSVAPSSSSLIARYRLTSMGVEKLLPRSREIETKVASVIGATGEIPETAHVPSRQPATAGSGQRDPSCGATDVRDGHVAPPQWAGRSVRQPHHL